MTYLRYWSPVAALLATFGVSLGLPAWPEKWTQAVLVFLLLPLAWSLHYVARSPWQWRSPQIWLWGALSVSLLQSVFVPNPYAGIVGWLSLFVLALVVTVSQSLTPEHRLPMLWGMLVLSVVTVGMSLLPMWVALPWQWVPPVGQSALNLAAAALPGLVSAGLLLWSAKRWGRILAAVGLAACLLPVLRPALPVAVRDAWHVQAQQSTAMQRLAQARPLGIGLGQYATVYPRFAKALTFQPAFAPSSVVEYGLGLGALPSVAWFGFFAFAILSMWRARMQHRWIFLGGIVFLLGFSSIAPVLQWSGALVGLGVLFGLGVQPLQTQETGGPSTRRWLRRGLLAVVLLLAAWSVGLTVAARAYVAAERLHRAGEDQLAAQQYQRALRLDPDPGKRWQYADMLWLLEHRTGQLAEAQRQAQLATAWNQDSSQAWQIEARIAYTQGKFIDAERFYQDALRRDPVFALDLYFSLADVYKKQGKVNEERAVLQRGLEQYPEKPTLADVANPFFLEQLTRMRGRLSSIPEQN